MPTSFTPLGRHICAEFQPGWQAWRWPLAWPTTVALSASAAPPDGSKGATVASGLGRPDRPPPRRSGARSARPVLQKVLNGTAKVEQRGASKVVRVGETATPGAGQGRGRGPVRRAQPREDGQDLRHPRRVREHAAPDFPDQDTGPATPGPTRSTGRCTTRSRSPTARRTTARSGRPDYSRAHYQHSTSAPATESLKSYYERQSSGRYSVDGTVTDWVKVRYNEARYGRSNGYPCAGNVCEQHRGPDPRRHRHVGRDQKAAGRTDAQIAADLASYDHGIATTSTATATSTSPTATSTTSRSSTPAATRPTATRSQGEDAIWSHRSKAFRTAARGPANNKDGGTQIGKTGLWVADFTIQPENGGVSVFAHEYAHDLGLPDQYDTAAGGDNAVNWWSLMAPEPRLRARGPGHRHPRRRPRRVGQAPARLARLRDRARRARPARSTSARTSTTAPRHRASSRRSRRRR